jgi:hypothetical protein
MKSERGGHWNRAGRRSGGYRPGKIVMSRLSKPELELLKQESEIRREFGEEGVKRFWEEVDRRKDQP